MVEGRNLDILRSAGFEVDKCAIELGGYEMYDEIVGDFYNESLTRVKDMIQYKKEGNMKSYEIEVHSMKGESLYLGITKLSNMCLEHQLKSAEGDIAYINANFDALMTEIAASLTVIKQYLGK